MKILLSMIICSQVAGSCLDPYPWPVVFDSQYDCLMEGYKQSMVKNGRDRSRRYQQIQHVYEILLHT